MAVATNAYIDKTDEQKAITEMVRQFVDNEVLPIAEEHDHEDKFPDALVGQMRELGLFGVTIPEEFGGMGLEGAVRLGYRRELDAVTDPAEREALFQQLVARMYEIGKSLSTASYFEIDDVIDPADTRRWLVALLDTAPPPAGRAGKKRPNIETW